MANKKSNTQWSVVSKATVHHVRISPRKARLVVDMIQGKQVDTALQILRFNPRKGAALAEKVLRSALANAREKQADLDSLWVTSAYVDMGRTIRRFMPAAQGRATPVRKRASHITVVLGERSR